MTRLLAICSVLLALPALARVHAAAHRQHVIWIGAHPDDEALVAPLLGLSGESSLLVLTQGENGNCVLSGGCGGDLGSIRASELARAAELLHAHLTLWSFSDVGSDVDATWSAEAGSHEELVHRIESVIAAEKATMVMTFDPNHGSTCHPAHRAAGALAAEAAGQLGIRVMFLETTAEVFPDGFLFRAATPGATEFDVTMAWSWIIADIRNYASQFTPAQVDGLQNVPAAQRRVWISTVPAGTTICGR